MSGEPASFLRTADGLSNAGGDGRVDLAGYSNAMGPQLCRRALNVLEGKAAGCS